jgi:hypothetical protein
VFVRRDDGTFYIPAHRRVTARLVNLIKESRWWSSRRVHRS